MALLQVKGNTGAFIAGSPVAATITIGTVYLTSGADTCKELNITNSTDDTTLYTATLLIPAEINSNLPSKSKYGLRRLDGSEAKYCSW